MLTKIFVVGCLEHDHNDPHTEVHDAVEPSDFFVFKICICSKYNKKNNKYNKI
jgi:hypothetical protein